MIEVPDDVFQMAMLFVFIAIIALFGAAMIALTDEPEDKP